MRIIDWSSDVCSSDLLARMMDHLDASGRFALLKLATGGLRVGISARLAKTGFAQAFNLDVDDVEECWHALAPPYAELFAWAAGRRSEERRVGKACVGRCRCRWLQEQ